MHSLLLEPGFTLISELCGIVYVVSPARSSRMKKAKRKEPPPEEPSILEHFLVPKHRVLSPEEAKHVLEKYRVQPHQLPYILVSDPVVKAIGAKPGDIIEIIRDSPTAGKAVYYRLVVSAEE